MRRKTQPNYQTNIPVHEQLRFQQSMLASSQILVIIWRVHTACFSLAVRAHGMFLAWPCVHTACF